jgi:hydroxymethylbilane synthase
MKIVIATRGSKLALWQAEFVKKELLKVDSSLDIHLKIVKTKGDIILDKPLAQIGGKGLFIKEVEQALLDGEAQIAVHSLKDFSVDFDEKHFELAAITKRGERRDVFLSNKYVSLAELPKNAVVGTGSIRRSMQLKLYREDLIIKNLRGNINSRIEKLNNEEFDAIILAKAGIKRLELQSEVKHREILDKDIMIPAMGQGALAVQTIKDEKIINLVSKLNDPITRLETTIERDFVRELNLGCHAPVGISARVLDTDIRIKAILMKEDGKIIKKELLVDFDEADNIGVEFAQKFK